MPQSREELRAKNRAYMRAWRLAHPEEAKARGKAQYQKHHAKIRAKRNADRTANRDKINADARAKQKAMLSDPESPGAVHYHTYQKRMSKHYRTLHPERSKIQHRKHRLAHLEEERAKARTREARRRKEHPELHLLALMAQILSGMQPLPVAPAIRARDASPIPSLYNHCS